MGVWRGCGKGDVYNHSHKCFVWCELTGIGERVGAGMLGLVAGGEISTTLVEVEASASCCVCVCVCVCVYACVCVCVRGID